MMITMNEYAERRKALMQKVGPHAVVILPAASEILRNGDAVYPFRQNSDFYYLTGFDEPEAALVLAPGREEGEYILFNRVRDPDRELWDGPRAGQDGAVKHFQADQAFPISELPAMLPRLFADRETIHYPLGTNHDFDRLVLQAVDQVRAKIRSGIQSPLAFVDVAASLHEMRLFKSTAEIHLMKQAAEITQKGHVKAMQTCKPGMKEYQLEAALLHEFISHGARSAAYCSIVGAGANSCILHYVHNHQTIRDGDLVLVDAGAEYQNYAADITRTFPANGKFSGEQRAIYELVLASQLAAIESLKPGALWPTAQDVIVKILTQGLVDLGILQGSVDGLLETEAYSPFYMHRSGHWLGLDVHDVGRYRIQTAWRDLQPGMAFTVEPGLYISANHPQVAARWHNIGVRIEDNVVITEIGCDVISKGIPKQISEIEAIMSHDPVAV
jgi:Xaa-Pro aminopeptidase